MDRFRVERRELLRLAAPLAGQQVGFQLMGLVDALVLGRYSDAALAGAGIGNNLLFAIVSVGLGIVMGMDTVVPQALGGGRTEDARRAVGAGIRLAVMVGLAATLLVMASPFVLDVAGVEHDVVAEARPYVFVRALGIVPFLITIAQRSYLAAHGRTRPLIVATIAGNAVNAVLDIALVFGVSAIGLPRLGVIGAAAATAAVQIVTAVIFGLAVRELNAHAPAPRSTRADLAKIVRFGWPVGAQIFAEVGIFGIATVAAGRLGKVPAAAHSIALNLASFTFSAAFGLASATSVRVGHAIGAGDRALARHRGVQGMRYALAIMAVAATTFLVAGHALASAFTADTAVVAATVPLLHIAALFQLSDGAQALGAGALRGLGDTHATLVGNLIGHYAIGLPIMLGLAFGASLGAPGLWWGLSVGLTVTAVYLVARFLAGTRATRV
ncbi:MAG TPA: MATE family efflux transporter [Kofleriaceae bacterium]|jgi:MATE family multidrug resistance protein